MLFFFFDLITYSTSYHQVANLETINMDISDDGGMILKSPRSLPRKTTFPHHILLAKFPIWTDSADMMRLVIKWESPESTPSFEKTNYHLAKDVDVRSV